MIGTSENRFFVEIGGGSNRDNTLNLHLRNGWRGYLINSGHYFLDGVTSNIEVLNITVTSKISIKFSKTCHLVKILTYFPSILTRMTIKYGKD